MCHFSAFDSFAKSILYIIKKPISLFYLIFSIYTFYTLGFEKFGSDPIYYSWVFLQRRFFQMFSYNSMI